MSIKRHLTAAAAVVLLLASTRASTAQPPAAPSESALIAVLRSDKPEAEKAITCKQLAVYGSAVAVPDLAPLLANERLASWARIALEAIPGAESDAALRKAAETLAGNLRIGAINSLGVRRDAGGVPLLTGLLKAEDPAVAAAAAAALGSIGTPEAGTQLAGALAASQSPAARDAVAQACVVCAERLHAAGKLGEATAIYDAVRMADVSEQRRAEAVRGAILVRGADGISLLVETLRSPAKRIANMGLFTARELGRGDAPNAVVAERVDRVLIDEVLAGKAGGPAAERAELVIDVLAERNAGRASDAVQKALLDAAAAGPKPVRLAAVTALGKTGSAAVVGPLLTVATDADPGFAVVAREAIAALPGAEVDAEIKRRLTNPDVKLLPVLVGVVADRRIAAVPEIMGLVASSDPAVRGAVFEALGNVVDLGNLGVLVEQAVAPRNQADAEAARKALKQAAVRMPDREACAEKLAAAVAAAPADTKIVLLDILGEVGGTRALAAMAAAGKSKDEPLEDAATRLLGKWMTADAAPVLLDLAKPETGCRFATRALRGFLRIPRQFALPDVERAELCRQALALATEEVDQTAIFDILARYPSTATLAVANEAAAKPGLAEKAQAAVAKITDKLPWLVFTGGAGPGKGKHVVLVSGDEEYRSEEALTQLAKILATHHGFTCTVLFAIDPKTGEISPNTVTNIPGLEALRKADLMVIATRFRNLPDEQMKEIDDYLRAGKPVIGMRTATHAFNIPGDRAYAHYGNGYGGPKKGWAEGFGRAVLGEKWISHHGHHGHESTRGMIAPTAKEHPILRGIADGDIWGPTDVYGVRLPLPGDSQPLILGQVLEGMKPDSPVVTGEDARKNNPMMPVAWTKTYAVEGGPKGRVFTTTMGSSTDLASEGVRRLLVNACYWATGLETAIPAKSVVDIVGTFEPTPFGFNKAKPGLKPANLR
ncbi:MAG: HEAT repeat domain-containing protein [Pirellulales bacterium]